MVHALGERSAHRQAVGIVFGGDLLGMALEGDIISDKICRQLIMGLWIRIVHGEVEWGGG